MKNIILVDDQPISNFIMHKNIEKLNLDLSVKEFTNPTEAMLFIEKEQTDFIFLDLNMPEMDGWTFLKEMNSKGLNIPVAILTSSTSSLDKARSNDFSNVVEFVIKPIDPALLYRILSQLER